MFNKILLPKFRDISCLLAFILLTQLLLFATLGFSQDEPTLKDIAGGRPQHQDVKAEDTPVNPPDSKEIENKEKTVVLVDELQRDTPASTIEGFLSATSRKDYETASKYLRLSKMPAGFDKTSSPELARMLRILINQKLWIDIDKLSNDYEGNLDDGLPKNIEFVSKAETPEGTKNLYLRRYRDASGNSFWQFSGDTVNNIPYLYSLYGYGAIGDYLSKVFGDISLFGIQLWQMFGILMLLIFGYLASCIFTSVVSYFISKNKHEMVNPVLQRLTRPVRLLLTITIAYFGIQFLSPGLSLKALLKTKTFFFIFLIWFSINFIDIMAILYRRRLEKIGKLKLVAIIKPISTAIKVLFVLFIVLIWLSNVGFQISTVLAGIGIGGLALALGAQKTIEDIFGAITIFTSSPVEIGDFCKFGDRLGTVEEIGMRTARIRTLDNSVISIPNSQFASMQIDNYSKREKFWYHPVIRLKHITTPDQMKEISSRISNVLQEHPKISNDNIRVRFKDIGLISFDIEVFAYAMVGDYAAFLETAEELNYSLIEIISDAGAEFAVPMQRYQA